MCSEGRLVSSPPASQRLFILPRYHRNITNIHPTLMYCFHSFDSRLLQRDVQTRDFPLTVSESFPPFLSFISILFPLIPVFLLPSRLLPCIFLLHPLHLLLTLCTSRLLLFPPNPRFLPLLHRSFISSSPNPHMNPKSFRSDTLRVVPELSYVSADAGQLLSCTTFS